MSYTENATPPSGPVCRRSRATWRCVAVLAAIITVGCGGKTNGDHAADSASSSGGSSDNGPDGAWGQPDGSGPWSPVCPATQPALGASCSANSVMCEYGDAWWSVACDQVVLCQDGRWVVGGAGQNTCLPQPQPNSPACPSNVEIIPNGSTCSQPSLECYYGQGVQCECHPPIDDAGGPPNWVCVPESGCPSSRPRLGAACTGQPSTCTYQPCVFEEVCIGGIWQAGNPGC
jgi:hypothetical protein